MSAPEVLLPAIRDEDGRELSFDEVLSRMIESGQAKLIPPAYDDSELALPDYAEDADSRLALFSEVLTQDEQDLVWRHAVNGKTFRELAEESGKSKQATQQRYGRILSRLRQLAEALPSDQDYDEWADDEDWEDWYDDDDVDSDDESVGEV